MPSPKQTGRSSFGRLLGFLMETPSVRDVLVEKTDRLYRNLRDWVTVDELVQPYEGARQVLAMTREDPLVVGPLPGAWLEEREPTFVERIQRVARIPLFTECNFDALADLVRGVSWQRGGPGETLVSPGRRADCFYRLEKGRLRCSWKGGDKVVEAGSVFGMPQILADVPYEFAMESLEDYAVSITPERDFLNTLELHLDFARAVHGAIIQTYLTGRPPVTGS